MSGRGPRSPDPAYRIAYRLGFVIAILAGAIPLADGFLSRDVPDLLRSPALAVVVAQPALLARRAMGRRRGALVSAAVLSVPLALVFSLVTLVLLVPAWAYVMAYREYRRTSPRVFPGIAAVLAFVFGVATFAMLFATEDPRCVRFADGLACTSDTINPLELLAVAATAAVAHQVLWRLAAPEPAAD